MHFDELKGTRWTGKCELWEDPMGDVAQVSDCTIAVGDGELSYEWSYKGAPHKGRVTLTKDGAEFTDSWHQQEPVSGKAVAKHGALIAFQYAYMETWGWRIAVCLREPTGELVVQMTNITPWGEEARAVRMACQRAE